MDIVIEPSSLCGEIGAIASKSDAHRVLICASLAEKTVHVKMQKNTSKDIQATIACIKAMGAQVETLENKYIITSGKPVEGYTLDCGESGTTLRLLLPVAAVMGREFTAVGHGRLPQRPMSHLVSAMNENGCEIDSDYLPIRVSEKLKSGIFKLPGNISSQYISGLLIALPMLEGDSRIVLTTKLNSVGYVNMTIDTLKQFNIDIKRTNDGFYIKGGQKYRADKEIEVQGDWSNSAFWLTVGAISGRITVNSLPKVSSQGDREIVRILDEMGAKVKTKVNSVSVCRTQLDSISLDAEDIPDLVPVVAVAMAVANGESTIYNISRLRLKESDRVHTVACMLNALGAEVEEKDNALVIKGKNKLSGGDVDSFNDHRIAMAAAVASTVCKNKVTITNAQAVEKSYPDFFNHFKTLGGKINVITNRE
ncbi:MAG TPA: 3-phosphoshikimate 1-carboxyvinyltransferase [Clostridia bacterium]|nr:3-phosphoshikimate 1-carboxyvinyltransferase [Clostridia bacterium]